MIIHDTELTQLLHDLGYYCDLYRIQLSAINKSEFEDITTYLKTYDIELTRMEHYLTLYNVEFVDPKRETWYKMKYYKSNNRLTYAIECPK